MDLQHQSQPKISPSPTIDTTNPSSWVEINKQAFAHNIAQYKKVIGNVLFAPVIKSNAYGHGIAPIAQLCQENPAVDRICVVSLSEAVMLHALGIKKPIVVLSILDHDLKALLDKAIIVTVYDMNTVEKLQDLGKKHHTKIVIHIKIDTGLSRLGIPAHDAADFIKKVSTFSCISIEGIFTHFANSESPDQKFVAYQLALFDYVIQQLHSMNIAIPLQHTTCSAAITAQQHSHYTMVRAGIGIYGLWPSPENKQITLMHHPSFSLQPVLTWKTRMLQLKEIPSGSYVGYDLTFKTERPTRIATVPVGYWDGYNRNLSNNSFVRINNQLAPVVGRIAMNLMMVDVSDISVSIDDEIILLGDYEGIRANDLAKQSGTINYDVVTTINPLLPRVVI